MFQTVAGENIGSYIQRLRLEHIAHLLVSTDFTLNQISEQTNYQTKFSLAKAFKKHFGVSTSQYREKYKPMYDEQHAVITPEIRSILPMKVFCIEVGEKYKDELRYKLIWDRLTNYARQRNEEKSNDKFVSLSMDDPAITPIDKCRFYLGVIIDNKENDFQPGVVVMLYSGISVTTLYCINSTGLFMKSGSRKVNIVLKAPLALKCI